MRADVLNASAEPTVAAYDVGRVNVTRGISEWLSQFQETFVGTE